MKPLILTLILLAQTSAEPSAAPAGNGILASGKEAATTVIDAAKKATDTAVGSVVDVTGDTSERLSAAGGETWNKLSQQFTEVVGTYLPHLAAALAILVCGWFVALVIAWIVRAAVRRLGIDRRLSRSMETERGAEPADVSRNIGRGVFWIIMLIVGIAFFQALGLTIVTEPLTAFVNQVFEYAPRFIAAGALLFVAWIVARLARLVVSKGLTAAKLDRRLTREAGVQSDEDLPLTKAISETTYWLVYLLFLPALLDALAVPGLLAPVQDVVQQILGFLPNLFGAAIILGVGWFVARMLQRVISNLSAAAGVDRLSERVRLNQFVGERKLSDILGLLVYILILVPVIVGSLNALQIEAITAPASGMLNDILAALPGIFAALLVMGVAVVVGRVVSTMAVSALRAIGFDKLPARLGIASESTEGSRSPSQIAGTVIMIAIVLVAVMQALPMLGFELLAGMMSEFLTFASQVFVGVVIFGFGLYFAKLVSVLIRDSAVANAGLLSHIARAAILVLAGAMGLQQMGVAQEIVNLAFGITLGAIGIAAAVAFGIGGRDAAKKLIDDFVKARVVEQNDVASRGRRRETQATT